ncbi:hypothetical protein MKW92_044764 [Papaver armeniacum]|nr:hypothetical protein MKW92_044764 [Papaver armeniacum]
MVRTNAVSIQCLEVQNPPPEQRIEHKAGLIQINVTKNLKKIIRFPDDSELPINEPISQFTNGQDADKIKNLCLRDRTFGLVSCMLSELQVPADRGVQERITRFVVETAEGAIRGSERMKSFLVYVELEVNIEEVINSEDSNDPDFDDGDDILSDNEDVDCSDGETISDGEDMHMPSDGEILHDEQVTSDEEIISDEEFTSHDNDLVNMIADLSLYASENQKVGASRSAIEGLKRERYSYESGGDNPAKNSSDANACVICMDKFEAGTMVTYMPCSHIFHEVCLVPWLQENYSCPLCRLEIQSCSSDQSAV